jgi:eukaryotic-like serine/threonine-protein kinase
MQASQAIRSSRAIGAPHDVRLCPGDNELARHAEGTLAATAQAAIEAHLVVCESCDLAAAMLRGSQASSLHVTEGGQIELDAFVRRTQLARALLPGAKLGRYKLLHRVGMGAMGVVFAAHDSELDRDVALKVLLECGDSQAMERERLLREARAMAKLTHANVVTVYEVGVADARVFLAMELVLGNTLKEWLAQTPAPIDIVRIFQAVARAIHAGHCAGIVHRDIKPQNILVSHDGTPKVTDFGLSETATVAGANGTLIGTPAYMSLEALTRSGAGAAADQFSLAVCLHEALCGRRPYVASTLEKLRIALRKPPLIDNAITGAVRLALQRALDPDPTLRFESLAEFADAIGYKHQSRGRVVAIAAAVGLAAVGLVAVIVAGVFGMRSATAGAGRPRETAFAARDSNSANTVGPEPRSAPLQLAVAAPTSSVIAESPPRLRSPGAALPSVAALPYPVATIAATQPKPASGAHSVGAQTYLPMPPAQLAPTVLHNDSAPQLAASVADSAWMRSRSLHPNRICAGAI